MPAAPSALEQISSVYRVLEELGIHAKDTILVLNKIDAARDRGQVEMLRARYPNAVPISARRRIGLDQLAEVVSRTLSRNFLDVDIETGVDNGRLLAYLAANGEVLSQRYNDSRVVVHCRIAQEHLGRLNDDTAIVRPHGNGNGKAAISENGSIRTSHEKFATIRPK